MPDCARLRIDLAAAADEVLEFVISAPEEDAFPVLPVHGHILEEVAQEEVGLAASGGAPVEDFGAPRS
jgi:hypothetical protein